MSTCASRLGGRAPAPASYLQGSPYLIHMGTGTWAGPSGQSSGSHKLWELQRLPARSACHWAQRPLPRGPSDATCWLFPHCLQSRTQDGPHQAGRGSRRGRQALGGKGGGGRVRRSWPSRATAPGSLVLPSAVEPAGTPPSCAPSLSARGTLGPEVIRGPRPFSQVAIKRLHLGVEGGLGSGWECVQGSPGQGWAHGQAGDFHPKDTGRLDLEAGCGSGPCHCWRECLFPVPGGILPQWWPRLF